MDWSFRRGMHLHSSIILSMTATFHTWVHAVIGRALRGERSMRTHSRHYIRGTRTHRHGIRVGTCFRPDGICTVFGPVSARHHDASVLRTSNLNSFLYELQNGHFSTTNEDPVFYTAFGDCAYNLGMQPPPIWSRGQSYRRADSLQLHDEVCTDGYGKK